MVAAVSMAAVVVVAMFPPTAVIVVIPPETGPVTMVFVMACAAPLRAMVVHGAGHCRTGSTAQSGTDDSTRASTHRLSDGRACSAAERTTQYSAVLIASMGRHRSASRTA